MMMDIGTFTTMFVGVSLGAIVLGFILALSIAKLVTIEKKTISIVALASSWIIFWGISYFTMG